MSKEKNKYIVCYSGGHSSAIAAIETVRAFGKDNVILLNHDISSKVEDLDIKRFKKEVADYLKLPITYANMSGWEDKDQFDVCIEKKAFKCSGQCFAFCTSELKTAPFNLYLDKNFPVVPGAVRSDVNIVYGFDSNEIERIERRTNIMRMRGYQTVYPLTWKKRTIFSIEEIGISRPITYDIFNHANCKGCLKAGKQHWFVVFCLYPDIWEKAKFAEKQIGHSILKNVYLSELEPEWSILKAKNFVPTEKVPYQKYWALARKLIKED